MSQKEEKSGNPSAQVEVVTPAAPVPALSATCSGGKSWAGKRPAQRRFRKFVPRPMLQPHLPQKFLVPQAKP
jgi:hypothetical protein